ncbi:MAG: SDR family NAD(P)-dependent oxidoreductase [Aestuariivirga sp.]
MTSAKLPWATAWVIGASTGIGAEIARQLASAGVKVAASSRSISADDETPNIKAWPLDVTDARAVAETFDKIETAIGPIDLVLVSVGTYKPLDGFSLTLADHRAGIEVNYMGVVNVLQAVLPNFRKKAAGHIAWISSVAGYAGLPKSAAYGPSKAALINLAEGLKPELNRAGISLSVVNPGFVKTPMTAKNDFSMPFLMEAEDAARRTIDGLARRKFEIAYPSRFVIILKLLRILPYSVFFFLTKRL